MGHGATARDGELTSLSLHNGATEESSEVTSVDFVQTERLESLDNRWRRRDREVWLWSLWNPH